jgi:hypothetical protein
MAFLGTIIKTLDIRDIKEEVIYPGLTSFSDLFALQKILINHYVKIEGLPQYPIDIHTKQSQNIIKDFSARIIEEFGEGFESYEIMMDMFHHGEDESDMIPHLQNFNEEVADAIHFWLELMIFSGYEVSHLKKWMETDWEVSFSNPDLLSEYMKLGGYLVETHLPLVKIPKRMVIRDSDLRDEFLRGGRALSKVLRQQMKVYLWDITYWLQLARNTLKNKPWKQSHMLTDLGQYENALKKCAYSMFTFLAFSGFTKESLFHIYYKKNKVNQFRIKSKY